MSNKKSTNNKFPFNNEIKQMKLELKQMIDNMSNEEFLHFVAFLSFSFEDFEDDDWNCDEEWEDAAEKFYDTQNKKSNNFNLFNDDSLPF